MRQSLNYIPLPATQVYNNLLDSYIMQKGFSKYLFCWFNQFIEYALGKRLEQTDIININQNETANHLYNQLEDQFLKQNKHPNHIKLTFFKILLYTFKIEWITLITLKLLHMFILALNPLVLSYMIQLFKTPRINGPLFLQTILYFSIWLISLYTIMVVLQFYENWFKNKIQLALMTKIYRNLYQAPFPLPPTGEIINLIQIDTLQITNLTRSALSIVILPLQIIVAFYIYYQMVGIASLIGVIGIIINIFSSLFYGRIYSLYQNRLMNSRDSRLKTVEEMLNGICTIKQNAYYHFFNDKIKHKRSKEMDDMKWQAYFQHTMNCLFSLIPVGVLFFTFRLFHIFSLESILVVNQNYSQLAKTIEEVPKSLADLVLALTSIDRIMNYFNHKQHKALIYINPDLAIQVTNGFFTWFRQPLIENSPKIQVLPDDYFQLENIDLQIKKGSKTLILGSNGSGKSSILYSLLGELETSDLTKLYVNGSISLATQEPWILQATIKENILMQTPLDEDRFVTALEMAQLCYDLGTMPAGHNTDIGERGQTLSGGQKKRLHLCRALYQEKDIYLLDNPCAALDHTTSQRIAQAIRTQMLGKTVIITSNSTEFWEFADQIVFMQEGRIVFDGSFEQFQKSKWNSQSKQKQQDLDDLEINEKAEIAYEQTDKLELFKRFDQKQNNMIDQEDRIIGQIDKSIFKQIYNLYGRTWVFVIVGVLSVSAMATNIFYSLKLAQITQISEQKDVSDLDKQSAVNAFLRLYPTCAVIGAIMTLVCGLLLAKRGAMASKVMHNNIIENLLRASVQYFYNVVLGSRIKNRLTTDIYQFDMMTPKSISYIFQFGFNFISMILAYMALASLISYPIIIIYFYWQINFTMKFVNLQLEVKRLQSISKSPVLNSVAETSQGIMYVKHCQNISDSLPKFNELLNVFQRNCLCETILQTWYLQKQLIIMVFLYILIISVNYLDTHLDDQSAAISIYLGLQVGESFRTIMTTIQEFYNSTIHFERCSSLISNIPLEVDLVDNQFEQSNEYLGEQEMKNINILEIENISVKYREDLENIINDVSFSLKEKERIAIIGRTGSGKTCLMQCITKLINPNIGTITYLGKNNMNIKQIRSLFSVLSQDPFVFEGTLKQNIDPNNNYNKQQIQQKLQNYNLINIPILSDLEYYIDYNGQNLSQGEKQLIVICRTLLQNSSILILDECTSNLDQEYAKIINITLEQFMKNKTVIGITHKLDQLNMFNSVILMNQGKIITQGDPEDIVNKYFSQKH